MKKISPDILLAFATIILFTFFTQCNKDDYELEFGPQKTFFKINNRDTLEAPATVYFVNGTQNADAYRWTFPDGKIIESNQTTDNSDFEGVQPDAVLYEQPGVFTATLVSTADGKEESFEKTFTVYKPKPKIFTDPNAIKFLEPVTFSATYYTYPGTDKDVSFSWDFGNGKTSIQATPTVTYDKPGLYKVTLTLNDTQESLVTTRNIEVKGELAPTLYATDAITNKMVAKKLYTVAPSEVFETDLSLGLHPLGISVYQDQVIVTEAGDNIKYSAWGTPADGKIIKTNLQGSSQTTITTTDEGGNAYVRDPFSCTVDDEGNVYWVNRFEGVRKLSILEENAAYPAVFIALIAADIGESSTYGWTDGDVNYVDGEIWYSKHGSGKGLYKYSTDGTFLSKVDNLVDYKIRSFAVDLNRLKIYIAVNIASGGLDPGLYVTDIDGSNPTLIDDLANFSNEGGDAEKTYITDMEIDQKSGYLYYPYRDKADIDDTGAVIGDGSSSGIKRYRLDGSQTPEFYISGIIPYGVGLDKEDR